MAFTVRRLGATAAFALALGISAPNGAWAGAAADQAAEAERLVQSGQPFEAMDAFDAATDSFWNELPLLLRNTFFVDSVSDYGQYQKRSSSEFKSGETVTVYIEPVGYGFGDLAGGRYQVAFSSALQITTPGGLVLAESTDFGKLVWEGQAKSHEVHLAIQVALPDLKPGTYDLALTLTDDASGDIATGRLSFTIAE